MPFPSHTERQAFHNKRTLARGVRIDKAILSTSERNAARKKFYLEYFAENRHKQSPFRDFFLRLLKTK